MSFDYDVVIVGAGPSGSSCAYNLKRQKPNAKILILDKSEFPRYKPCGGGISPEVANYLDFDLTDSIDSVVNDVVIRANNRDYSSNSYKIWMVRREKFDNFLLNKAKDIGVTVMTSCEAQEINNNLDGCVVKTNLGNFNADAVVLAHGSRSNLVKKSGFHLTNKVAAAIEYEHYVPDTNNKLYIDLDCLAHGYAWNFPKSDGMSIGVGAYIKTQPVSLKAILRFFMNRFTSEDIDKKSIHGHPIEVYSGRKNLVYNRVLLIGEIAGCVDPLTAEGIRPAIKSGYLASSILAKFITSGKTKVLRQYNKLFHNEIGCDLRYARIIAYFLFKHYKKIIPIFSSDTAVNGYLSVFSGTSSYKQVVKKKLFKLLLRIIW